MNGINVIVAPFHAGVRCSRVGAGPRRLLAAGLLDALSNTGAGVAMTEIPGVDDFEGEIGRSFEVMRRVALAVADARRCGRFPLVLAGNCNASVGTYAGLAGDCAGVVWFDAHPDFDTPDECMSGYFDGMGVATLAGQCWKRLAGSIPGFHAMELSRLIYCGVRDFEPVQREKVETHAIKAVYGSTAGPVPFAEDLAALLRNMDGSPMVHLDLDCLDTTVGHANHYAAPGGLSIDNLAACMTATVSRAPPAAMTIASFDPSMPGSDAIAAAGVRAAVIAAQAAQLGQNGASET